MPTYTPPVGFHFSVQFEGLSTGSNDTMFQSVSGLSVDIETEEVAVGGENRFKLKLPVRTKFPNLVLKRGMLTDSDLIGWCRDAIENFEFSPINLLISLLDEEHNELMSWNVVGAYPVKWNVEEFNAMESKLVIETVELSYNYFNIK
jgi:phage tail-like protein